MSDSTIKLDKDVSHLPRQLRQIADLLSNDHGEILHEAADVIDQYRAKSETEALTSGERPRGN